MSEIRLTGKGVPTRMTVGVVGQHYEDLNTGNIYECLVASEHSKLNGNIGGGYVWKLKYTGDDRRDHEAIFGVGSSGGGNMVEKVLYQTDNIEFAELEENSGFRIIDELTSVVNIDVGQPVTVVYDGVTNALKVKETTAQFEGEDPYIMRYVGNSGMAASVPNSMTINGAEDTGEPFFIEFYAEEGSQRIVTIIKSDEPVHSIKITTMVEAPATGSERPLIIKGDFSKQLGESDITANMSYAEVQTRLREGTLSDIVGWSMKDGYAKHYYASSFPYESEDAVIDFHLSGSTSSYDDVRIHFNNNVLEVYPIPR